MWKENNEVDSLKTITLDLILARSHCYSIRSNLKKMGPLQFCLPVFLGIHRNPKQKEFFNLKFHAGVKNCHFGNFSEWAGMAVPC